MGEKTFDERAVAPVVSTILMVAIAVILASVIATFVLDIGEDVEDPGPNIGQTSGTFEAQDGTDGGIARLTHVAGEPVPVEEMAVVVDATDACGEIERLINLPVGSGQAYEDENVESGEITESIISGESGGAGGVFREDTGNTFDAGEFFEFRIASTECGLSPGDEVLVDLVHEPTNSIMASQVLLVQEPTDD